mmetsp:Transcript_77569/g.154048  ORF Transcript_77569/g.154048 Transcript_77569/m.154048 type:complete len:188 (-) Transcript_77569:157-720(-)|eukprot:CAMPEP_0174700716 /NCGR_PEP_ID=MMETSP1094-20130205/5586_1 /TAXON_ID=156173 /ORGANISM="Chrysochromulina brevifilum, Strain UTEX LB 985" /LENGTH=187 /DNA_ID=CAMNT_0015898241 /DNA_START=28 /DNA_END=591 /DNA_ORIENTATION=-
MVQPWKDNLTPGDLIIPSVLNTFFVTQCLVEYSLGVWVSVAPQARSHHLAAFYEWKSDAPVLKYVMPPLLLLFPVALVIILLEAVRSLFGLRRAMLLRHLADLLKAFTICTIIYMITAKVMPAEQEVVALAPTCSVSAKAAVAAKCQTALAGITDIAGIMLVLNMLMAAGDALGYAGNRPTELQKKD